VAERVSLLELLRLEVAVDRRDDGDEPCSQTAGRDGQNESGHQGGEGAPGRRGGRGRVFPFSKLSAGGRGRVFPFSKLSAT
jgi:hypothetical protein